MTGLFTKSNKKARLVKISDIVWPKETFQCTVLLVVEEFVVIGRLTQFQMMGNDEGGIHFPGANLLQTHFPMFLRERLTAGHRQMFLHHWTDGEMVHRVVVNADQGDRAHFARTRDHFRENVSRVRFQVEKAFHFVKQRLGVIETRGFERTIDASRNLENVARRHLDDG